MGKLAKFVLGWVGQGLAWGNEGREASIIWSIADLF